MGDADCLLLSSFGPIPRGAEARFVALVPELIAASHLALQGQYGWQTYTPNLRQLFRKRISRGLLRGRRGTVRTALGTTHAPSPAQSTIDSRSLCAGAFQARRDVVAWGEDLERDGWSVTRLLLDFAPQTILLLP